MTKLNLYSHSVTDACMMSVKIGTNCPQGGASNHGGRTVLKIADDGATCMAVRVSEWQKEHPKEIEIIVGGDSEARALAEVLEFAAETLRTLLSGEKPKSEPETFNCQEEFLVKVRS